MKRGSFVDVLYGALSKRKSVQLVFWGPERSGVVIVKIREGRILSVESTWGGGRKELSKLFLWGAGEYAEKPINEKVTLDGEMGEAEALTAEDFGGLEKDEEVYAVLQGSSSPPETSEATMERGIELLEMVQIRSLVKANRYELLDTILSHLPLKEQWVRKAEQWALAKEIFREVFRNHATGLLQGRSGKGKIWGVFLGGTVVGSVFWKTAVDELREGRVALRYVHLLSTVEPMEWRFFEVEERILTGVGVYFTGSPMIQGFLPGGSLLWWMDALDRASVPGDLFYVLPGDDLGGGFVILHDREIQVFHRGEAFSLDQIRKSLTPEGLLQVWGFSGEL